MSDRGVTNIILNNSYENGNAEGVTRGDKLLRSRGGEKSVGDTGEDMHRPGDKLQNSK